MTALQTQLDRHLAAIDGMDQKAALLPPALGLVGVLGVVTSGATGWRLACDLLGLVSGVVAVASCFLTLRVETLAPGGDEDQIAHATDLAITDFDSRLARSLAAAARVCMIAEKRKANWLNVAFAATFAAVVFWVLAHAVGG